MSSFCMNLHLSPYLYLQAVKALERLLRYTIRAGARSVSLVECLTGGGGVEGSSLIGIYALYP